MLRALLSTAVVVPDCQLLLTGTIANPRVLRTFVPGPGDAVDQAPTIALWRVVDPDGVDTVRKFR